MANLPHKIQNSAVDLLEKCSSSRSRAGSVVERVGKMDAAGVSHSAIAAQLSENSRSGNTYSTEAVKVLCHLYADSRSGTLVTAKQTTALINDAHNDEWDSDWMPNMS